MLEFINRYRNDPKRTVLTLKMNNALTMATLGELNMAREAKIKNEEDTCGEGSCPIDFGSDAEHAFNAGSNEVELNYSENDGCCCQGKFALPCGTASVKGGINSSGTVRFLLCDLVAGALAAGALSFAATRIMELFKGKC